MVTSQEVQRKKREQSADRTVWPTITCQNGQSSFWVKGSVCQWVSVCVSDRAAALTGKGSAPSWITKPSIRWVRMWDPSNAWAGLLSPLCWLLSVFPFPEVMAGAQAAPHLPTQQHHINIHWLIHRRESSHHGNSLILSVFWQSRFRFSFIHTW